MKMTPEERLEARVTAMLRRDEKAFARMAAREEAADRMIGELNGGRCYVWPVGGKYREGTRLELINFLICNNYV